jgi:diaminohydroxyphosphoribosylaminopyrimidine deaminase/5-amino-6-(5-phosphoribosylamino)uracil reductase
MRRALRMAVASRGRTWPNPGVGCLLVRDGRLLGAGRHRRCGGDHAEVAALADCRARGHDPAGATAYVTLAPCTRTGRTPPCTGALIAARVARVVAALVDPMQDAPAPILAGAGIGYEVGCEAVAACELHGGFLTRIRTGRPRVTGKWAMTLDGSLACAGGDAGWISCPVARTRARRRRRAVDAVLVGAGTVTADDPELLALDPARHPVRVVVDPALRNAAVAAGRRLWRQPLAAPVWVVHDAAAPAAARRTLEALGTRLLPVGSAHDPAAVLTVLGAAGINDLLVEGGSRLHGAWLRADAYDRIEIHLGPRTLGGGLPVAAGAGAAVMADARGWILRGGPVRCGRSVCLIYDRDATRA